jgi:subtilisin family serine protease
VKIIQRHLAALNVLAILLLAVTALPDTAGGAPWAASVQQLTPPAKLAKAGNAIPNTYIVVLDDARVGPARSLGEMRARVSGIADNLALAHGGKIGFIYEAALRGFSVELPNEEAAVAISRNPLVKFVEEAAVIPLLAEQLNPSWGLDRIDQTVGRDQRYIYNATGAGVVVYVIDSGIRATHTDFGGRASNTADFIGGGNDACVTSFSNNDCLGHGTAVASIVGGNMYGVAKGVTIRGLKACRAFNFGECFTPAIVAAVNRVTSDHLNSPSVPVVANMSLGGDQSFDPSFSVNNAVINSINQGITYAIAAGNNNDDARFYFPASVAQALTVGAMDINDSRAFFGSGASNFGHGVDVFAPGFGVLAASHTSDFGQTDFGGTSGASPHVAGAAALYLQGRTARTACSSTPLSGPANTFDGTASTCPDRVSQLIVSNASLDKLSNVGGTDRFGIFVESPNRLLYTGSLPAPANPIDNVRFFVWQQYTDHLGRGPDHGGLNDWVNYIEGCGADSQCLIYRRTETARGFIHSWEFHNQHPALQNPGTPEYNQEFVRQCYLVYLRREPDPGGYEAWLNTLTTTGDEHGVVHGFIYSNEYRRRFGGG